MTGAYLLQQIINAVTVSAFYSLLAVAYVLMHGITGRINLTFGALSVWAGYLTINTALTLMLLNPGQTLLPVAGAILAAILGTAALGLTIERLTLRPMIKERSLAILTMTLALAIVLEELMRIMNGSKEIWLMPVLADPVVLGTAGGAILQVPLIRLLTMAAAVIVGLAVIALTERHRFGRIWRAVSQDPRMAELCGIDTRAVFTISFVSACGLTAMAGALSAVHYGAVGYYSGLVIGLKTLFVAVVGGLNSVTGAFAGAILLGFIETLWSAYFDADYRDVVALLTLSGLMVLFPAGLFAGAQRADHR